MTAMRRVRVNGADLALHDTGGAGVTMVFQHGLCGDALQTAEAFPDDLRFRRVTLECRGHGQSQVDGPFSISGFSSDLEAVMEELPGPVVLGGISMGAAIAARIAVRRPDLVSGLVLVRPAWIAGAAPDNLNGIAEVGRLMSLMPPDAARASFVSGPIGTHLALAGPDNYASLLGFFDRRPAAEAARLLGGISADGPGVTEDQLAQIAVPTLVCGTAMDVVHPMGFAHRLTDLIPNASFADLPVKALDKAAHLAALRRQLSDFLSRFSKEFQ